MHTHPKGSPFFDPDQTASTTIIQNAFLQGSASDDHVGALRT